MDKHLIAKLSIAAIAASIPSAALAETVSQEARIPFASEVRDFRADGGDAIFVQDSGRQWYRGTFLAPCRELPFAERLGFVDRGTGGLDRWATILVRGERCTLASFVKSPPPPSKPRKHRA